MALRRIGYWKASLGDEYPLPQELRAEYAPGVRDRLGRYLESGAVFARYRGHSWCRYGCPGPNGSAELTDGVWVWPEGLAHYVRRHPVALPPDFVADATRGSVPAPASAGQSEQPGEVDDGYWLGWARPFRSPATETLLAEARAAAARACEAALEAVAAEWTTELGEDDRTCLSAGCDRRAVTEKALCGRCFAERDRDSVLSGAEGHELGRVMAMLPAGRAAAARNGRKPWWKLG